MSAKSPVNSSASIPQRAKIKKSAEEATSEISRSSSSLRVLVIADVTAESFSLSVPSPLTS
jgi:hypothetical protein